MLKAHAKRLHSLVLSGDLVLTTCVFLGLLGVELRGILSGGDSLGAPVVLLGIAACVAWPAALKRLGVYGSQRRTSLASILFRLLAAGAVATAVMAAALFTASAPLPPSFPAVCGFLQFLALACLRVAAFSSLRVARRQGRNTRDVVIVGTGLRARLVSEDIARHPEWGLRIVAFVDDCDTPVDPTLAAARVHKLIEFPALVEERVVDEVIVACPRSMLSVIAPVVNVCAEVGVPVTLLTDIFGDFLPAPRIDRFGAQAVLNFAPVHHSRPMLAVKRGIDMIGASVFLIALAPIIAASAALIRWTSPGPIFFRQARCGLNGRRFYMWKLRTMCLGAEAIQEQVFHLNEAEGPIFKIRHDPRVTSVGRVLRRWSLDELPQLWNVLKGDMSLVGPRPPLPGEVAQYETAQRRRLSMRPGLTCIWQVSGRSTIGFEEWVNLDLEYIDCWSIALDLKLLLRTIPAIVTGKGAS